MSVAWQEAIEDRPAGPGVPPALRAILLDSSAWHEGLETFARATNLAVALVDGEGRLLGERINFRPTWEFLGASHKSHPPSCCFSLDPLAPCTCYAAALGRGATTLASDRTGLVHFAVPLVLQSQPLGALLAGQVFTRYPEQLAVERAAARLGRRPGDAWALARLEQPLRQATLEVYADLLATLGRTFLQNRLQTLLEGQRLAEMTRLRDHAVAETMERRRVEAELQASEHLFRQMVQDVKDYAIFMLDTAGHVTSWNEGAARIFGYGAEEIIGTHFGVFFIPEDREAGKPEQEVETAARDGRAEDDNWLVRRDDSRFWASGVMTALRDGTGRLRGFSKVARDATASKRTVDTLKDDDRRKDDFLGMLAHELRNPLAPIMNSLQVIRLSDQRAPRQQAREMLERQVLHMVRLVDDLLDVSRIRRGKIELRLERVNLANVVSDAVETSRPHIEARGHELTVTLPPEPLWLEVDPLRLGQVLANLLNNAAKYTPNGGQIWLRAERVSGDLESPQPQAVVRIRDTGVGVPAEMLQRIFELFTQVDRSLERSQGGLGIGLTLARSLVELQGGTLTAASEGPGTGSEFTVRLPLAAERLAVSEPGKKDEVNGPLKIRRSLRVLVVDDNADAAESLRLLLQLTGQDVQCACDGAAALRVAVDYRPDVVLLDIGLPGMSGYDVARRLRELPDLNSAMLVALTGWGTEEHRRRSHDAGFDHHLTKPVDMQVLQKLLTAVATDR